MDAFEALGGMCGSRCPHHPDRSTGPDTGDAHNTRDREPGGREGQQRRPDIGTAPDTGDAHNTRDREPGGRVGQQRRPDIGTAPGGGPDC